jgi:hypothetical protein
MVWVTSRKIKAIVRRSGRYHVIRWNVPSVSSKARKGDFVKALDHFELLQSPIN